VTSYSTRSGKSFRWIAPFLRPYRYQLSLLATLSLAEIALRVLLPFPMKTIIDRLVGSRSGVSALYIVAVVAAGVLLQLTHQLVLLVHTRTQTRIGQQIVYDTQARLFAHLQYVSLYEHDRVPTSDVVYRVSNDATCLEQLLLRGVFPMAFSILTLVGMFTVLIRIEPTLAVLALAVVPFLYVSLRLHLRRMHDGADRAKKLESALAGRVMESLSAIRLVKAFAREEHELSRFNTVARSAMRERLSVTRLESFFSFLVGSVTVLGTSAVLGVGALYVSQGRITVGTLLMIMTYLGFIYGPLSAIANTTGSLQHAAASINRVREVLDLPQEHVSDMAGAAQADRFSGAILFDHVSFTYPDGREALRGITFTTQPGETIALVGPSGAGKTTLVAMLGRMYSPTAGRILIDEQDIAAMDVYSLREQIAVVPQEPVLFRGTIKENIRYGLLSADDAAVARAIRGAHADTFIAQLEQGADTPLGESGSGLSVGQRQRLSMARAFPKDAPILILDEPTAALDTISEERVIAAMRELRKGRTTLMIAHRLASVRTADRILVMEGGQLVAEGRHDDLLRSCGLYRRLCSTFTEETSALSA
jgi:ATP-binding cassette subfamily B protein